MATQRYTPVEQNSNEDSISVTDSESGTEYLQSQQEWEESLRQLQHLVGAVLLPFMGKWLGRKWSHWMYARYLRQGLFPALFGLK